MKHPRFVPALFLTLLAAGSWFRLARLGETTLRADTINFWNICQRGLTAGEIWKSWMELMGPSGHFPFANAFIQWFLDTFHLPLSHLTIHLPSAFWGIVAVAAAFGLGRHVRDARTGLVAMALAAFSPYMIQTSREAYFYAPMVAGAFLALWALLWTWNVSAAGQRVGPGLYVVHGAGFFLLTLSQPSGLSLALLVALVHAGLLIRRFRREKRAPIENMILLALCVVVAIPLFTQPWGIAQLRNNISAAHLQSATQDAARLDFPIGQSLYKALTIFAWGRTPVRVAFTALVLAGAVFSVMRSWRSRPVLLLLPVLVVVLLAVNMTGQVRANLIFDPRYVSAFLPAYLAILALGLEGLGVAMARRWKGAGAAPALLGVALLATPAFLCTRLNGNPTPYRAIQEWADTRLARGSPVLVDRWLEPWNELRLYPSTNVFFTFTVPNEPLATFHQTQWRQTAVRFFEQYPEAAYLEIAKSYWEEPDVGPWTWPREHFARHEILRNDAGVRLRQLGLASRSDFYTSNTNRLIVECFYNRREDIVEQARRAGKQAIVLYGDGWGYTKSQDYRDWRVLEAGAELILFNLADQPADLRLTLSGLAHSGSKRVSLPGGQAQEFPPGQLIQLQLGLPAAPPGRRNVILLDSLWEMNRIPLLVESVHVSVAPPSPGKAPEPGP